MRPKHVYWDADLTGLCLQLPVVNTDWDKNLAIAHSNMWQTASVNWPVLSSLNVITSLHARDLIKPFVSGFEAIS